MTSKLSDPSRNMLIYVISRSIVEIKSRDITLLYVLYCVISRPIIILVNVSVYKNNVSDDIFMEIESFGCFIVTIQSSLLTHKVRVTRLPGFKGPKT